MSEVDRVVVVGDVGGTVVVVDGGLVVMVVVVAAAWGPISCSPRQPSMAVIAASPMTPARMTDHRRYQGGLGSCIGSLRRRC
jgi:hypothetical protein